jgi:hypothetical protein
MPIEGPGLMSPESPCLLHATYEMHFPLLVFIFWLFFGILFWREGY